MWKMIRSVVQSSRKSWPISAELTEEESQKLLMLKVEVMAVVAVFTMCRKGKAYMS